MEQVTAATLDAYIERYAKARRGERNDNTDSEAQFVLVARHLGAYILTTGVGIYWVGMQSATARWTADGCGAPFTSVRGALDAVMLKVRCGDALLMYSEDSSTRLRWLADKIQALKEQGGSWYTAVL